jgi:hypothetical protein
MFLANAGCRRMQHLAAVWLSRCAERDGIPIHRADVERSFETRGLMLNVPFRPLDRYDVVGRRDGMNQLLTLNSEMRLFHRTTQAKAICLDRRRLMARGEQARKGKARRKCAASGQ